MSCAPLPWNRHRSNGYCLDSRGKIIRSVLCNILSATIVLSTVHTHTHTHINIPNSLWIGLSHWAQFTVLRFIFMAALRSRCGHYIFILSFLLLFFFPRLISAVAEIGCLPYFHTWCGLSANLECRSETCCKRIAEIGLQDAKNRHLGTIAQLCRAISLQLRHVSTIGKKAC